MKYQLFKIMYLPGGPLIDFVCERHSREAIDRIARDKLNIVNVNPKVVHHQSRADYFIREDNS